jgi:PAS domain S-box-containing protein
MERRGAPADAPEQEGGTSRELTYHLRQQELLARFGLCALRFTDLDELLREATRLSAEGLRTGLCKVLEWRPEEDRLLVRAGVGWAAGVIGEATIGADLESPSGYALKTGRPVISNHLAEETRFRTPRLLVQHGVRRAINVIIRGERSGTPFGVLEADSPEEGRFTEADIAFMEGFANLLGVAIERHRAEAALRESEEQTRLIIEGARDYAILTTDTGGRVTSWSPGAEAIFGWKADEIIGSPGDVLFTPEDRAKGVPQRELATARERGYAEDERWHIRKDGMLFYASGSVRPLHDAAGRERGFLKVARDATQRRHVQEELREQAERLKLAIEAADIGTWDFNPVTGTLRWDARCKALFGLPPDAEVDYATFLAGLHPEDREPANAAVQRALDPTGPGRFDTEYRTVGLQDGMERWIAASGRAFFEQGRAVRFIGTVLDITGRKRAEETNARLAAIVAASSDAIISFAPEDGRILTWNKGAEDLFGYSEAEAVGAPVSLLLPPEQPEGPTGVFAWAMEDGKVQVETVRIAKDGTRIDVAITATRMQAPDGRVMGVSATFRDIRERKTAEALMREAVQHQEVLTREVSHRVKNSLQLVAGLLTLQARAAKDPDVRRAIEDAGARVSTIADVHDQLWRRSEVERVDLASFLERLCAKLADTASGQRLVYEAEPVAMSADRAIPVALLVNELVTNAFKYAYPESEGEIRVSLSVPEPSRVRLEVSDRGVGLPAGFDPNQPGESLGMRLIRGFVRQLRGQLDVSSAAPGARFVLEFPREDA